MHQLFFQHHPTLNTAQLSARGYGLVRKIAAERYNLPQNSMEIQRTPKGKPYFTSLPDFHFSISHSHGGLAVAVNACPVGVDVELVRDVNAQRLGRRVFKEDEVFSDLPQFFRLWTAKEARAKCRGIGLGEYISTAQIDDELKVFTQSFDVTGGGCYVVSVAM
ncbi:MAG: 4'-phosphopantetheinyl transferase superfamily protein [Oscillospiraceae bacterium]|nr:4'-phosphopantetheinyl transferase superfamily protein [Oscillospiraceae bacterium]